MLKFLYWDEVSAALIKRYVINNLYFHPRVSTVISQLVNPSQHKIEMKIIFSESELKYWKGSADKEPENIISRLKLYLTFPLYSEVKLEHILRIIRRKCIILSVSGVIVDGVVALVLMLLAVVLG